MKKNTLAPLLFSFILILAFAFTFKAQNTAADKAQLPVVEDEADVLQKYIEISLLPSNSIQKRRNIFIKASAEEKAGLTKLHLVMQLVKRASLNVEQKDLIIQAIFQINAEIYDKDSPNRIKLQEATKLFEQKIRSIFTLQDAAEIFASIGGNESDAKALQKYKIISNINSMNKRKDYFQSASAIDKVHIWRGHLASQLISRPDLNEEQQRLVIESLLLVSAEFYDTPLHNRQWEIKVNQPLQTFAKRLLNVFSNDEVAAIFGQVGETVKRFDQSEVPESGSCQCNVDSLYQCGSQSCFGGACAKKVEGCGLFWAFECNGVCPAV